MTRWRPLPPTLPGAARQLVEHLRVMKGRTGLSLAGLARRTAYSKSSWQRYLSGDRLPPRSAAQVLCRLGGGDQTRLLALWELAEQAWPQGAVEPPVPPPPVPPPPVPPPPASAPPAWRPPSARTPALDTEPATEPAVESDVESDPGSDPHPYAEPDPYAERVPESAAADSAPRRKPRRKPRTRLRRKPWSKPRRKPTSRPESEPRSEAEPGTEPGTESAAAAGTRRWRTAALAAFGLVALLIAGLLWALPRELLSRVCRSTRSGTGRCP
ncbi:helix-turn-helix domain-containing protein [Streptomyces sp. NPDC093970]|uniref:helix-turn-helix domain-containing protein n=1 Tax=Streptomyces sp. NPDC093970 TaxID=3155076 RepID=UPI00343C9D4C